MRTPLIPLTLAVAAAAACGTGPKKAEQTAFQVPQRDLTLQQVERPQVVVASPAELAREPVTRPRTQRPRTARRPERPLPAPARREAPATTTPATTPQSSAIAASPPATNADEPPDPYALPPGKTVTVIPASTGPSIDPARTDGDLPEVRRGTIFTGGGGGDCGGRHPGRGQRPDGFRGLH